MSKSLFARAFEQIKDTICQHLFKLKRKTELLRSSSFDDIKSQFFEWLTYGMQQNHRSKMNTRSLRSPNEKQNYKFANNA